MAEDTPRLSEDDMTKISSIIQDIVKCQIFEEEEQLWMAMWYIINKAIADVHNDLMECLDHEQSVSALFQTALDEVISDENKRLGHDSDGDVPIETPAAKTAFYALSAYTVASEQFQRRRALPVPEDDDIPI